MVTRGQALMDERAASAKVEQLTIHMASVTRELLSNTGAYPDADARDGPRAGDLDRPGAVRRRLRPGAAQPRARLRAVAGRRARASRRSRMIGKGAVPGRPGRAARRGRAALRGRRHRDDVAARSCHLGAYGNKHGLEMRAMGSEGQARRRPRARLDLAVPAGRHRPPPGPARGRRRSTTASGRSTRSSTPASAGWSATGRRASSARARSRCSTCCTRARAAASARRAL